MITPDPVELDSAPCANMKTTLGVIASTTWEKDLGVLPDGTIIVVSIGLQQALTSMAGTVNARSIAVIICFVFVFML
jgi:hypothetical protein